ncbi:hypothetical protein MXMO3_00922 [Maritalea myrionectae]|uniref:Uncharacterized protein n=1 Tax=Maritalea myrionectae TaxID=454601 RepID=A0A2R4MBU9_9HYPH|nr:hypothetical protein [Maritalea myrionectae]AVX03453.1 hypothetical protein MXMO3_00922 [Maritalea myrionectae]
MEKILKQSGRKYENFFLRSVVLGTSEQDADQDIPIGKHQIVAENLTFLPYSLKLESILKDQKNNMGFRTSEPQRPSVWTASFECLNNQETCENELLTVNTLDTYFEFSIQSSLMFFKRLEWVQWKEERLNPMIEVKISREQWTSQT